MSERQSQYNVAGLIGEKDFQQTVRDYARSHGWLVWCTYDSRRSPEGEPDLRMIRPPRVIFAELKSERGRLTERQENALYQLQMCPGVEAYLWRPGDWPEIEQILGRLA